MAGAGATTMFHENAKDATVKRKKGSGSSLTTEAEFQ